MEFGGQGEDHVKVRNLQERGLLPGQPGFPRERLAVGAVAVASGVVTGLLVPAVIAAVQVTAQRGGAAERQHRHEPPRLRGDRVGSQKSVPVAADRLRHGGRVG